MQRYDDCINVLTVSMSPRKRLKCLRATHLICRRENTAARDGFDIAPGPTVWKRPVEKLKQFSGQKQAKYLYSPGRNNSGRFGGDRGPFSRNRAIAVQPRAFLPSRNGNYFAHRSKKYGISVLHNGLFSRSLKRRKILRLLSSTARTAERRRIYFQVAGERDANERYLDKFSTSGTSTAVPNRARNREGGKKKLPFYSISCKKLREREARLSAYDARSENVCLHTNIAVSL